MALEKLAAFVDRSPPLLRRAWRQWLQVAYDSQHVVAVDNLRSALTLRNALRQGELRALGVGLNRWRSMSQHASAETVKSAAVAACREQVAREEWEASVVRTLKMRTMLWVANSQRTALTRWQQFTSHHKLQEQVREQRFLAVDKLELVARRLERKMVAKAWKSWVHLFRGAKSSEAARNAKSTFKRTKRDLRKATRAQGLRMLDAISSRLAKEATGYAFKYWATLCVVQPRAEHQRRQLRALWTFASAEKILAGPRAKLYAAWSRWVSHTHAARTESERAELALEQRQASAQFAQKQQRVAVARLVAVLGRALQGRVCRAFGGWVAYLDEEDVMAERSALTQAVEEKEGELERWKREASTLQKRVHDELLPRIEQLNALNVEQRQQVRSCSVSFTPPHTHTQTHTLAVLLLTNT